MNNSAAISSDNVSFSYGALPVLKNVSFHVADKEFIGIFGPNGGGKTTLLNLIMGFLKPTNGSLTVFNQKPSAASQFIGWVPQAFQYDFSFPITVKEVVLMGRLFSLPWLGRYSKKDLELVNEALEKLGMQSYASRPFNALSGGQIQRVLIARALVNNPALLLLDEPTTHVDQTTLTKIYALIEDLKGKITIVMVTHELNTLAKTVDRFFCVQNTLTEYKPKEVCEHFALGIYHPTLLKGGS